MSTSLDSSLDVLVPYLDSFGLRTSVLGSGLFCFWNWKYIFKLKFENVKDVKRWWYSSSHIKKSFRDALIYQKVCGIIVECQGDYFKEN